MCKCVYRSNQVVRLSHSRPYVGMCLMTCSKCIFLSCFFFILLFNSKQLKAISFFLKCFEQYEEKNFPFPQHSIVVTTFHIEVWFLFSKWKDYVSQLFFFCNTFIMYLCTKDYKYPYSYWQEVINYMLICAT